MTRARLDPEPELEPSRELVRQAAAELVASIRRRDEPIFRQSVPLTVAGRTRLMRLADLLDDEPGSILTISLGREDRNALSRIVRAALHDPA